jgi:hypothetical protein
MTIRKVTSLTVLVSSFVLVVTSSVLYIVPKGRVAHWADWRLWGLSKEAWTNIHINIGILFLLFLIVHLYYNWKPLVSYLKNNAKKLKVFTKELHVALLLSTFCIFGTYLNIPPFSTVIEISNYFKEAATQKYGEPPYGHAELSPIQSFAQKTGIDLQRGLILLEQAGYKVDSEEQTLLEIAKKYKVPPQQIYLTMAPAIDLPFANEGLPEQAAPGTGKLTLEKFCNLYGLNKESILVALEASGMQAREDMTIKTIGEGNGMSTHEVYERIKSVAKD